MNGILRPRIWMWVLGTLVVLGLFAWKAPGVCSLLGASFIVAYVCAPVVDFLERHRVNRGLGVAVVLVAAAVVLVGIVLLLIPVILNQASKVSERLPAAVAWLDTDVIPRLEASFNIKLPQTPGDLLAQARAHLADLGPGVASHVWQVVIRSVGGALRILGAVANAILVPFIAFYLTRDYHLIWPRFEALVPARRVEAVRSVVRDVDHVLSGFVRGQLL